MTVMTAARNLAGLRYEDCSLQELRNFLRDRTTTTRPITDPCRRFGSGLSRCNVISQLQDLDKEAIFPLQDLPTELRLLIYDELLERQDPDSLKKLYTAILATSKDVHGEAEPELYTKTNLRILIEATAIKSRDDITETFVRIGHCERSLLTTSDPRIVTSACELYNTFPAALGKISNITLQIVLHSDRCRGLLKSKLHAEQFNQVNQILAALTAMWRDCDVLRSLKIEFLDDTGSVYIPMSPPAQIACLATGEMEVGELKRIFYPLCTLDNKVAIVGGQLPAAITEYLSQPRCISLPAPLNLVAVYARLTIRVREIVDRVRNAGLCCSQAVDWKDHKDCDILRLEKKMNIPRKRTLACEIISEESDHALALDLGEVEWSLGGLKSAETGQGSGKRWE